MGPLADLGFGRIAGYLLAVPQAARDRLGLLAVRDLRCVHDLAELWLAISAATCYAAMSTAASARSPGRDGAVDPTVFRPDHAEPGCFAGEVPG